MAEDLVPTSITPQFSANGSAYTVISEPSPSGEIGVTKSGTHRAQEILLHLFLKPHNSQGKLPLFPSNLDLTGHGLLIIQKQLNIPHVRQKKYVKVWFLGCFIIEKVLNFSKNFNIIYKTLNILYVLLLMSFNFFSSTYFYILPTKWNLKWYCV